MTDSAGNASNPSGRPPPAGPPRRPFLGVVFRCCNLYARIYRRDDLTAYAGRCPKCGKALRVPIGSGGSGQRFFGTKA